MSKLQFRKWLRKIKQPADESKFFVKSAWRPVVLEFSGIPRAGKTRCIKAVKEFLEYFGWKVLAPQEGAFLSPQELKQRKELILFNILAVSHALTSLIDGIFVRRENYAAILLDRGLFDAVCWFTFLEQDRKALGSHERRIITNFLRLGRWYDCVDMLVLFTCTPAVSVRRERESTLKPESGTTSDLAFLRGLMRQHKLNLGCYASDFPRVLHLDTSSVSDPRATAVTIVDELLAFIEQQQLLAVGA